MRSWFTVHPRVCGERKWHDKGNSRRTGSSPRVRGTRFITSLFSLGSRFIPACAGNAPPAGAPGRRPPVHPRVCGERRLDVVGSENNAGSSPRVRGTPRLLPFVGRSERFIPACAGNAQRRRIRHRHRPVHPRVCGERGDKGIQGSGESGSSPRVRGTPVRLVVEIQRLRFIPACAGNASAPRSAQLLRAVHPRLCGERMLTPGDQQMGDGSSPRVRGTLLLASCREAPRTVHPRVCGERALASISCIDMVGSSPRVRGTPVCTCIARREISVHPRVCGERARVHRSPMGERRFIPACAGNATAPAEVRYMPTVHPRVCGERIRKMLPCPNLNGSSPRVRGTRAVSATRLLGGRFIPACAGNARSALGMSDT